MKFNWIWRSAIVAIACTAGTLLQAQAFEQPLKDLVADSARRIAIAHQVALTKWDSGSPVEDSARESQIIQGVTVAAQAKGLGEAYSADFFRAQIEANKLVQYSLLTEWHKSGRAPKHEPVDLKSTIRPELDRLQSNLLSDLSGSSDFRSRPDCPAIVAKATAQYLDGQHEPLDGLDGIALNRALATVCTH